MSNKLNVRLNYKHILFMKCITLGNKDNTLLTLIRAYFNSKYNL